MTASAQDLPRLDCALAVPARVVSGAPVMLRLTLSNRGSKGVQVLTWGSPFEEAWFAPFVDLRRGDERLEYRGAALKRGDPSADEYLHLAPGQTRHADIDLAAAFDLGRPGRYRIEPRIVLHDVFSDAAGPTPRPRARHVGLPLACPGAGFEVRSG